GGATRAAWQAGVRVRLADLQVPPPSFLRRLRLTVAFGRRVYWINGQPVGGTGFTLGGRSLLCLDTSSHPAQVLAHSTQHEFFHAIEQQLGLPLDHSSLPLNAPGTQYNREVPLIIPFGVAQNLPGFVSAYAQSAGREDRAEVFSCLMGKYDDVEQLATRDPYVAAKAQCIQNLLTRL